MDKAELRQFLENNLKIKINKDYIPGEGQEITVILELYDDSTGVYNTVSWDSISLRS